MIHVCLLHFVLQFQFQFDYYKINNEYNLMNENFNIISFKEE